MAKQPPKGAPSPGQDWRDRDVIGTMEDMTHENLVHLLQVKLKLSPGEGMIAAQRAELLAMVMWSIHKEASDLVQLTVVNNDLIARRLSVSKLAQRVVTALAEVWRPDGLRHMHSGNKREH